MNSKKRQIEQLLVKMDSVLNQWDNMSFDEVELSDEQTTVLAQIDRQIQGTIASLENLKYIIE